MKTFRRDKLRRLCEAGRLVLVGSYHFDDMYGASRTNGGIPVQMAPAESHERQEGICYMQPWDFKTQSGCCYENPNGSVTLIVHSNCNYTFRMVAAH